MGCFGRFHQAWQGTRATATAGKWCLDTGRGGTCWHMTGINPTSHRPTPRCGVAIIGNVWILVLLHFKLHCSAISCFFYPSMHRWSAKFFLTLLNGGTLLILWGYLGTQTLKKTLRFNEISIHIARAFHFHTIDVFNATLPYVHAPFLVPLSWM